MPKRRMERMARSVQAEVSRVILFELADPRMRFVTVTRVEMTPDLRTAKVFLSILGTDTDVRLSFQAIQHAGRHIRRVLADRLQARRTPVLQFKLDPGVRKSVEMSTLIGNLLADTSTPDQSVQPPPITEHHNNDPDNDEFPTSPH